MSACNGLPLSTTTTYYYYYYHHYYYYYYYCTTYMRVCLHLTALHLTAPLPAMKKKTTAAAATITKHLSLSVRYPFSPIINRYIYIYIYLTSLVISSRHFNFSTVILLIFVCFFLPRARLLSPSFIFPNILFSIIYLFER